MVASGCAVRTKYSPFIGRKTAGVQCDACGLLLRRGFRRVVDGMEEEAARGRVRAGFGAAAGGENARDLRKGELAASNVDHGSDEIAHHVVEEAVATDAVDDELAVLGGALFPCRREDGADGRLRRHRGRFYFLDLGFNEIGFAVSEVGIGCGKAEEVVLAFKEARARLERIERKRPRAGVDVAGEEGRAEERRRICCAQDAVFVSFGDGGMARMKGALDSFGFGDADRWRKCAIDGAEQIAGRDGGAKSEACNLRERVDPGVGAAGALRERRFSRDAAERRLKLTLDGWKAGLHLPALEVGSVVGQCELPGLKAGFRLGIRAGLRLIGHWFRCFPAYLTRDGRAGARWASVEGDRAWACHCFGRYSL